MWPQKIGHCTLKIVDKAGLHWYLDSHLTFVVIVRAQTYGDASSILRPCALVECSV